MHTLRSIIFFFIGRKVYFLANSYISYTVSLTLIWSQMLEGRHSSELLIYRFVFLTNCLSFFLCLEESMSRRILALILSLFDLSEIPASGKLNLRNNKISLVVSRFQIWLLVDFDFGCGKWSLLAQDLVFGRF